MADISIHAPRTGSDFPRKQRLYISMRFQSTLPARGATLSTAPPVVCRWIFQSTLPARGATVCAIILLGDNAISIHAPRTGSDWQRMTRRNIKMVFQSTLPARGATVYADANKEAQYYFNPRSPHGERRKGAREGKCACNISIHAPRTGSDGRVLEADALTIISIHAPRTGSDCAK